MSQQKYIKDLLAHTSMGEVKSIQTPIAIDKSLSLTDGCNLQTTTKYRQVVSSLQYLPFRRLNIAFIVNKLSRFLHKSTTSHWSTMKQVLQYLKYTITSSIFLRKNSLLSLHAYSKIDWVGDKDDCTFTSAYILFMGSNPISWSSWKQRSIARSYTEAEYRFVASTATKLFWVQSLFFF